MPKLTAEERARINQANSEGLVELEREPELDELALKILGERFGLSPKDQNLLERRFYALQSARQPKRGTRFLL